MSDIFADATVQITPSTRGFITKLNEDLVEVMKKVKPPVVRVKPGLSKGFIGDLRTQVNTAVAKVQGQVKPIRVRVLIETPSRRALQEVVRGAPVTLPGVVAAGVQGPGVVQAAENERLLANLRAQGARDLGLLEVAEGKVTDARKKGAQATKQSMSLEDRMAKANKDAAAIQKTLNEREFKAATATGALSQEKKKLAIADKAVADATKVRTFQLTAETKAVQEAAIAARALHLERVKELETAGAGAGAGAQAGLAKSVQTARARGFGDLSSAVTGLREADTAFATAGKSAKDLATQEAILVQRSAALKSAKLAVAQATKAESDTLRVATAATLKKAEADQLASKAAIKSINDQIKLDQKAAQARNALVRQQTQAAARQAAGEKRRSEQLSRGGQASILSLAGIRGATLAASRSFLVGAAAITVFANAVRQFADLERNLHVFEATTSATHEEMEAVREQARLLGADLTLPSVTAEEAAGAMVELAKAGLTVADSIAAARSVLELATAAAIDNAEATRLVANVLNAFSLSGKEATNVADTLANAANAAQGSIADIGTAFQQAASAGRQVGLSFQDTAVFLTILAKNGIRGSDAGTSLRTALIRLINPSKKAKEEFQKLGISIHDASGNLRPDVFLQIAAATNEMSAANRDATIALIGGQDAFRAVTILGRQTVEQFLAMRRALREEGTAAELAAARTKGLHGSIDALQSILETVGTTMASHVGPGIAGFVYQLGQGITAMSESADLATTLQSSLQAVSASFNLLGDAIQAVSVVALPLAGLLLKATNAVSVTTILAGVVAFKSLNAVMDGAIFRLKILRPLFGAIAAARFGTALAASMAGLNAAQLAAQPAVTGFARLTQVQNQLAASSAAAAPRANSLRTALRGVGSAALVAATSTTALTIGIAAAAAGLVYLITRETAAEKATRKLKEATEELISVQSRLAESGRERRDAPLAVNATRLAVVEAEEAAARARASFNAAPKGTFAQTKAQLELAVALDNVEIAQNAYTDASERARQAEARHRDIIEEAAKARTEEIKTLKDLVAAKIDEARIDVRNTPAAQQGAEQEKRSVELVTEAIQKRADKAREEDSVQGRALANRLELLAKVNTAVKGLPDGAIDIVLRAPNVSAAAQALIAQFRKAGDDASAASVQSILLGLGILPKRLRDFVDAGIRPELDELFGDVGTQIGKTMAQKAAAAFAAAMSSSEIKRSQLDTAEDLAVIASGATGATLPVARDRLAQARADRARAEARIADLESRGKITGLKTARQERARAIAEERAAIEDIRSIEEQFASEEKAELDKIVEAQGKRAQNIVDAIEGGKRARALQRKITSAGLTDWLGDDLKTNKMWLAYLKNTKETLAARLKAAGATKEVIQKALQAINDIIFATTNSIKKLAGEIADNTRERREAAQAIAMERFDLRISIAQSRENVAAELRARRAKLAAITRELVRMKEQYGKNSIQWLRVKDAQVAEIAAIRELNKSLDEKKNVNAQMQFKFLQMQSGFAANLLGNLIPGGLAPGGLVGGTTAGAGGGAASAAAAAAEAIRKERSGISPFEHGRGGRSVSGRVSSDRAAKETGQIAGPTQAGQSRELQLLNQILQTLRAIQRGTGHPEAKHARVAGSGGGGGGVDIL